MRSFQKCCTREFYYEQRSCIILSDNGHELVNKYIPILIRDLFAKRVLNLHFLVLKDSDDSQPLELLNQYHCYLEGVLRSKQMDDFLLDLNTSEKIISVISQTDCRISISFHFLFMPQSFEIIFVNKSIVKSQKIKKVSSDPHKALNDIAHHLGFDDKESLIRHSVKEKWFNDEEWYTNLLSSIKQLNSQ